MEVVTEHMSVNFNEIKTVADLIAANSKPEEIDESSLSHKLFEEVMNYDPSIGLEVSLKILIALKRFHEIMLLKNIDEGNSDVAAQWAADHRSFEIALDAIFDIQL